jgi:hypothetical protein
MTDIPRSTLAWSAAPETMGAACGRSARLHAGLRRPATTSRNEKAVIRLVYDFPQGKTHTRTLGRRQREFNSVKTEEREKKANRLETR